MEAILEPVENVLSRIKVKYQEIDPRIPVAFILFLYLILGLTVLGFNRSPVQAITTTISCLVFELVLTRIFKGVWVFPLSAMITSFSLSFLLNYSHDYFLLFVPVFFAIGSKHLVTFKGKHALNPAMIGVSMSLLFSHDLITAAPAYQWNGIGAMSVFVLMLGLMFVIPKV
ncbi:MAG TPA: RnfABCDGE type electron transport complex subunit D, partial [Bdellovibrio sp.]|nr:RnfABCDGE type electron transport complex subunit D [Bdellovibrio sp.]